MIDKSALMDEHVRQASGDFPLVMVVSRMLKRGAVGLLSYHGHEERRQQLTTSYRVVVVRTTVTDAIDVFVEGCRHQSRRRRRLWATAWCAAEQRKTWSRVSTGSPWASH